MGIGGAVSAMPLFALDNKGCDVKFSGIAPVVLDKPVSGVVKLTEGKNTVIEFFWYGCTHCNDLQPYMNNWIQSDKNLLVIRIPAVLSSQWEPGARLFYALHEAGIFSEKLHEAVFNAVHKEKSLNLSVMSDIQSFLTKEGVTFDDLRKVVTFMSSDKVSKRIAAAKFVVNEYKLIGTPTLVVENQYLVTASEAGSTAKVVPATKKVIEDINASKVKCR